MAKTYIYLHHQGFDVFLKDRELTKEECYCACCDDYDTLITVCENETTLKATLQELYRTGYEAI